MTEVDLSWFKPLPKQLEFINSNAKEVFYAGGFGSGKTISGCVRTLRVALMFPGTQILVARQVSDALNLTTKKVLLDGDDKPPVIPPELIYDRTEGDEGHMMPNGKKSTGKSVTLTNGSEIIFRHFQDWKPERLRGLNLGAFYLDECTECSEKMWLELGARARNPAGPLWSWGSTNPNGHDWVWRRAHEDSGQATADLIVAASTENTHLPAGYLKWLSEQPLEWVKRYVLASFDTASGQIFSEWNPQIHVVPVDEGFELPESWRAIESIDHGERNPTAWLLGKVDDDGNLWIDREYYEAGLRTSVHIEAISSLRGHYGLDHRQQPICDPSMFASRAEGVSTADAYRAAGIRLKAGINSRKVTFDRVAEYLHPREHDVFPPLHQLAGLPGAPRLFVLSRCRNLIRELPEYLWRDYSPAVAETREAPEEPRKLNDHAVDALRYMAAELPKPTQPPPAFHEPPKDERRRAISGGVRDRTF